jgi:hypothetical protein
MGFDVRMAEDWNLRLDEFSDSRFMHMIAMGMSNENSVKILNAQTKPSQLARDVSWTEATVDKNRGPGIPDERGIASA